MLCAWAPAPMRPTLTGMSNPLALALQVLAPRLVPDGDCVLLVRDGQRNTDILRLPGVPCGIESLGDRGPERSGLPPRGLQVASAPEQLLARLIDRRLGDHESPSSRH